MRMRWGRADRGGARASGAACEGGAAGGVCREGGGAGRAKGRRRAEAWPVSKCVRIE